MKLTKKQFCERVWFVLLAGSVLVAATTLSGGGACGAAEPPKDNVKPEELQKVAQALESVQARVHPVRPRKVLILSETPGSGHDHIPLSARAFEVAGRKTGAFTATVSKDVASIAPEQLKEFDAIVFNSNNGELFEGRDDLKASLLEFVKGGKGVVGVHSVANCNLKWKEFGELLGGYFSAHPRQNGKILLNMPVKLDEPQHPLLAAFKGQDFEITDEIFQFRAPYARAKLRVLLSVDGAKLTLDPNSSKQADGNYAVSWIHSYGKGRVFFCTLAHLRSTFWNPTVLQYYLDGIQFAAGDLKLDPASLAPSGKP